MTLATTPSVNSAKLLYYTVCVAFCVHGGILLSVLFEEAWTPLYTWETIGLGCSTLCLLLYQRLGPSSFNKLLGLLVFFCATRWSYSWLRGDASEIYTTVVSILLYFPVLVACGTLSGAPVILGLGISGALSVCLLIGVTRPELAQSPIVEWRVAPAIIGAYALYSLLFISWRRHLNAWRDAQERERKLSLTLQTTTAHQLASRMGAVSKLSGEVAHEFNNLLNVISPLCDFLKEELKETKSLNDVQDIQLATERMRVLSHELLSLTQTSRVITEEVDITSVVEDARRKLERADLSAQICHVHLDPNLKEMKVSGVRDELLRLIELLSEHAQSLTPTEPVILSLNSIRASQITPALDEIQRGEVALLSIGQRLDLTRDALSDQHVKPLTLDYIESEIKLSAAYAIALRGGGTIRVGMNEQDRVTFNVYLPVIHERLDSITLNQTLGAGHLEELTSDLQRIREQDPPYDSDHVSDDHVSERHITEQFTERQLDLSSLAHQAGELEASQESEPLHILLVDDEELVLKVVARSLERIGFRVTSTSSSIRALELLREDAARYKLLISDVRMPGLSGPELIQRAQDEQLELPLYLYITGHIDDQAAASLKVSAERVLFKPFTPKTLQTRVEQILKSHT